MFPNPINHISEAYTDFLDNKSDPRINGYPLMSSPLPTIVIVLLYVTFVKVIGPMIMEHRKPLVLKKLMVFYNGFHALFSVWMFHQGTVAAWGANFSFRCQPISYEETPAQLYVVRLSYIFFISRFLEFIDTIFIVLRKKNNQISTLHVVHHSLVPIITWFGTKYVPGGHYTLAGYINVFVHSFMYMYYMLAALGPEYKKYLFWKKYLTALQLIQFVLVMAHTAQTIIIDCDVPKSFAIVVAFQAILFFALFSNFYVTQYTKNQKFKGKSLWDYDLTANITNKLAPLLSMCIPNQELLYDDPVSSSGVGAEEKFNRGYVEQNSGPAVSLRNRNHVE